MRNTIRIIRNFAIYLLPATLLATASALLVALLYYPAPSSGLADESRNTAVVDDRYERAHAETLFATMLADALRQIQAERETQARTLIYRYDDYAVPSAERPARLGVAPPSIGNGGDSGRPTLTRL
ncbi:MAG: hypothetical protein RKO24_11720 [Candidatus Competibacter sp.]|nr:hypothetical protein [Candidatus Competibacter sp.]